MVERHQSWRMRSLLSRLAHVVERTGLALTGGSCGLFVAAHIARSDFNLIGSGAAILGMMIYGAIGFYLGIDTPQLPFDDAHSHIDAAEFLSSAGTLCATLAALAALATAPDADAAEQSA